MAFGGILGRSDRQREVDNALAQARARIDELLAALEAATAAAGAEGEAHRQAQAQAAADAATARIRDAEDRAKALTQATEALRERVQTLETQLYLARSDQQRSAALADALRRDA